ncbi:TrmH family RNA methyltransferase [Yinghuangia sp. ASG 101]|uniref:TrmH family RNA methyltransferase n=1 Tax=Yinghuangia sp. ASG 101 TaxID=2896848 RepID=UPI001E374DD4|nr:TrmH family RNA methyltransferase [Yinghuangia sp. ASG 101]UGQ15236.1 TrmH family RNA methyltransferase [Yinghuangia sp. ASG 101]
MATEIEQRWRAAVPGAVLLDGFHALKHAVRFGADVRVAVATDRKAVLAMAEELSPDIAARLDALVVEVPEAAFRGLVPRVHPTGTAALAVLPSPEATREVFDRTARPAPVVVLENPRNLGNVGAVVRLAAGFGATGVATTGTLDPWHPNAVRGSAGLHFATAVARLAPGDLPAGPVHVLDPDGDDLREVVLPDDAVLVFGSERHGVSSAMRSRAARRVAVPMRPGVSSFNLATTVGMALFRWSQGRP